MTIYDPKTGEPLEWPRGLFWSHSALGRCEDCSLMYGSTNVMKLYPFEESPQMKAGNVTHAQLENYVTNGTDVPLMLKGIQRFIDKLSERAIEVIPERWVNVTYDIRSTPQAFHDDVSYRGKIDFTAIMKDDAVIVDYKTSSEPRETFEQLEYQALATLVERPKLRRVYGYYAYTKFARRGMEPVSREDIPRLVKLIKPRLERMKKVRDEKLYTPNPGYYCRWCPVVTCKFNPKRG
jgi:PD-(D/E)XK nuclease superfamily